MKEPLSAPQASQREAKKKPNLLMRLLAFLLTLALILGAVVLVVYRDRVNFDAMRRYFAYRSLSRTESGQAESFRHEGSVKDQFSAVGSGLMACSDSGVRLYSESGAKIAEQQISLINPILSTVGDATLVYDAGGRDLFVYSEKNQDFRSPAEVNADILSARLNASGQLALTTRATGFKGSVTVYDSDLAPRLQLNLSSSFVTDAMVSKDNKTLAAVTMGQGDTGFESRLALYTLNRAEGDARPDATCPLGGNVVLDLGELGGRYCALGDTALHLVGRDGAPAGGYDYAGRYLKEFSLAGDEFATLLLGKYRAGTTADLVVVDGTGAEKAALTLNEQVLAISAAGRYIGVLYSDRLEVYTPDLTLYSTLQGTQGARKVLMHDDGTAMIITNETAKLYIPS